MDGKLLNLYKKRALTSVGYQKSAGTPGEEALNQLIANMII